MEMFLTGMFFGMVTLAIVHCVVLWFSKPKKQGE